MQFRGHPPLSRDAIFRVLDLCHSAAAEILAHYHNEATAGLLRSKDDRSPLTRADLASHKILSEGLNALTPALPLLSEESGPGEIRQRRNWEAFWLVDPLDGTREFLERSGEFTINVALIVAQRPVLGVLYEPMTRSANLGIPGEGAWRLRREGEHWTSTPLQTRTLSNDHMTVLASRRHRNPRLDLCLDFLSASRTLERQNSGSALKFCDLAAGRGDFYPRFSPCSEWDVAAGDALVCAAGGEVLGLDGLPLKYNARDTLLSPHFIAVGDRNAPVWSRLLEALASHF
jgi:3'(2'), 5'-bisphosphate nucleotidase